MKKIIILMVALLLLSGCGVKDSYESKCEGTFSCMYKLYRMQSLTMKNLERDCQTFNAKITARTTTDINPKYTNSTDEITAKMYREGDICYYTFKTYRIPDEGLLKTTEKRECEFPIGVDRETFRQAYNKTNTEYCRYEETKASGPIVTYLNNP